MPAADPWLPMELDQRAMAGEGAAEEALEGGLEGLIIVWPGYFSAPSRATPVPRLELSPDCYAGTMESVHWHFEHHTLERKLPSLNIPAVFVLGVASPIPPGTASPRQR
jgi:hypothetical protein